jgi:hypothetical protein
VTEAAAATVWILVSPCRRTGEPLACVCTAEPGRSPDYNGLRLSLGNLDDICPVRICTPAAHEKYRHHP